MEATMAKISPPRVVVAVLRTRVMTSVVATGEAHNHRVVDVNAKVWKVTLAIEGR